MSNTLPLAGFRVFISYCSRDRRAATRVARWLVDAGAQAIWDEKLPAGMKYREELRSFIGNAHIFLVLLTTSAATRPWVLQEIGYAAALRIPIVPVSTGPLPNGLIGDLHALRISADWRDLEERLAGVPWANFGTSYCAGPQTALATLVRSPLDRVTLLGQFSRRVLSLGAAGTVRQRAALSTFCIPEAPVMDKAWITFDGNRQRTPDYHGRQREERLALGALAMASGCRLIIDPEISLKALGTPARRARLWNLRHSLRTLGDQVQAITYRRRDGGNVTVVGGWWAAESLVPDVQGYAETTFTWHAGLVQWYVDRFDQEFATLCHELRVQPKDATESTLAKIERVLRRLQ